MKELAQTPCYVLLAVALALPASSCIKREPIPVVEADEGEKVTAQKKRKAAPTEPTGNWGEVEGKDLLEGKGVAAFSLSGKTDHVKLSEVSVETQDFDSAVRASVKAKTKNPWDVQLQAPIPAAVEQGDVLLATFFARSLAAESESGDGQTEFVFELGEDPYTKSATHSVNVGREWTLVRVPFQAETTYPPGKAQATFRLGFAAQRLEIGGVRIENFEKELALADLPTTPVTYRGMASDAKWRAKAKKRIRQHRTATIEVVVQDAAGVPVADADVNLELVRHAFVFGTAAPARRVLSDDENFLETISELFNSVTLEHDLEWLPLAGQWGGGYSLERAHEASRLLSEMDLAPRGHALVRPSFRHLPKGLDELRDDPGKLAARVEEHIANVVGTLNEEVVAWHLVDEPYANHDLTDILGAKAMADWFHAARKVDPDGRLFVNDAAILTGGGGTTPHLEFYENLIRDLLEAEAPLDGIGMQGHFGATVTPPEDLLRILDRFAKLKKPIVVTEFDMPGVQGELAANYLRDFYTALFSHPAVEGIIMWGFWDGEHWKNDAPLYELDWAPKPAAQSYRDLVLSQWHTKAEGKTNTEGTWTTRGFLGDYEVTVTRGERRVDTEGKLERRGSRWVIELPSEQADGTETDGTQADGTQADGTQADGTQADGTQADGTQADGADQPSD